ncbi:SPRY domain-containing protein [Lysinibacillus sp. NPDC097279]|uniref:SPRY domain-containing protein n=1 Tax=Lysinibacillus sp. NPDC097279 TaxID=3364143 RepID=UPI00381B0C7D
MTTWNPIEKGATITLSNENLTANNILQQSSVKSTDPKTSGVWFCEIKVDALNYNCIGIGSNDLPMTSAIGTNANYFFYYYNGAKYNSGVATTYAPAYAVGDIIGILVDFNNGELTFYKNGVNLGVAYNNINKLSNFCIIASSGTTTGNGGFTANFGATPFKYPPNSNDLPLGVKSYDDSQFISYESKSFILHNGIFKKYNKKIPSDGGVKLIAPMTKPTQDGITITQSSSDGANYGYLATSPTSGWISSSGATPTNPEWITIDFGFGNEKVVTSYEAKAYLGTAYITKHKFQGSNNGVDFVDLFDTTEPMTATLKKYRFSNDIAYRFYRIYAYGSSGGNGRASLGNVQLIQKPTPIIKPFWADFSITLPNAAQFSKNGMESLSPLTRTVTTFEPMVMSERNDILGVDEVGKVFSKTINLKRYFDIRSIEVEVK